MQNSNQIDIEIDKLVLYLDDHLHINKVDFGCVQIKKIAIRGSIQTG